MDERDVARLFIAEMRALLPVAQRHLDTLSSAYTTEVQRSVAGSEICRLATAMADLSSGFHAEDCASLAAAIAAAYEETRVARQPSMALLAATADILTYLHARMQLMAEHSRVLAPSEDERVAMNRLLASLREAQQRVTRELPEYPSYSPRDTRPLDTVPSVPSVPYTPIPSMPTPHVPQDIPTPIPGSTAHLTNADAAETLAELAHELGKSGNGAHPSLGIASASAYDVLASSQLTDEDRALLEEFRHSELLPPRVPRVTGPLPELHEPDAPDASDGAPAVESASAGSHPTPSVPEATSGPHVDFDTAPTLTSGEPERVVHDSSPVPIPGPHPPSTQPTAHPLTAHSLTAEDLDAIPPEMRRVFISETTADIQDLRRSLLRFEEDGDEAMLGEMGRIAHKVKGNAATLNFPVFAELTLAFEDILTAFPRQPSETLPETASALVQGIDLLQGALDAVIADQEIDPALVQRAYLLRDMLRANADYGAGGALAIHRPPPAAYAPPVTAATATGEENQGLATRQPQVTGDDREPILRVDINRLNDLMKHVSALALNRAALTQARNEIDSLQDELEHSLARLNVLSRDITDLHAVLGHMTAPRNDGEVKDAARSPLGRLGLNLFGFSGRTPQQSVAGRETSSDAAQAEQAQINALLRAAGSAYAPPALPQDPPGLDLERYTEVDHALRSLSEVVADVTTTSRTLRGVLIRLSQVSQEQAGLAGDMQHDVMRIRLVPLAELTPRLHFEVRRVQQVASKKIKFTTSGEQTEIDRNISEALSEPLIQLIRNAILHGIEPPAERIEQGKSEVGSIWLHAYYTNSDVIIEVGDDGRGVNPFGLAGVAFAKGYIDAESARSMSYTEALDLMFMPGVSTFDEAQTLGGRGIGLDQVRTAIQQLKGTISVRSEQGKGSVFRIRVPISLSIVRSLHVRAGNQHFAVPFTSVQRTLSLTPDQILISTPNPQPSGPAGAHSSAPTEQIPLEQRIRVERVGKGARQPDRQFPTAEAGYEEIPAFVLTDLLGFEHRPHDSQMALVIDLGHQRAALLINDVVTEQELVVQVLPKHLRRRSLRGATVTPEGQLLLLLDVHELVTAALDGSRPRKVAPTRSTLQAAPTLAPRVLVVDDSVSIRGTLDRVLRRAGFDVQLARDGIEALEMMLVSPPPVLVLDIEMPRLDGFELLSIIRGSPQFQGVRVAMLTSRAAKVHRTHALSLGAEAYLIKPCPNDILVETIRSLLMEPAITR
ncbi:MAG: response regulator [Ktedonobacterales bacterium]